MYGRYGVDSFGQIYHLGIPDPYADRRMDASGNPFLAGMGRYHLFFNFRMFSKNTYKRAAENQKYLQMTRGIRTFFLQAA